MEKLFFALPMGAILTFMYGCQQQIEMVKILLFVCAIDFVTGVVKSVYEKGFSRKIFWRGITKKIAELLLVSVAYQVDKVGILKDVANLQQIALYAYISYETLSIVSQFKQLDVKIPNEFNLLKKRGAKNVR